MQHADSRADAAAAGVRYFACSLNYRDRHTVLSVTHARPAASQRSLFLAASYARAYRRTLLTQQTTCNGSQRHVIQSACNTMQIQIIIVVPITGCFCFQQLKCHQLKQIPTSQARCHHQQIVQKQADGHSRWRCRHFQSHQPLLPAVARQVRAATAAAARPPTESASACRAPTPCRCPAPDPVSGCGSIGRQRV